MHTLVDTCIWSQVLRRHSNHNNHAHELRDLISDNRACIIKPDQTRMLSGILP